MKRNKNINKSYAVPSAVVYCWLFPKLFHMYCRRSYAAQPNRILNFLLWTFCVSFCAISAWDTGWERIAFLKFSYHNWLLRGEGSWLPHKTIIRDDWMCLWFEDTFLYSIKRSLFLLFCFLTKAPFVFTSMSIPFNQHNQYLLILFFLLLQYLHTIWFLTFWNACKWRGNNASRSINQIKKFFLLINRHSKCELRKKNIFNQN